MKKMFFLVASLAVLSLTSCASVNSVRLSGALTEKSYEVSCDYSSIDVSSSIKVLYSLNTDKVTVQADSAVLGMVCVEEKGKVLKIYMRGGFNKGDIGPVTVTVPASDGRPCHSRKVMYGSQRGFQYRIGRFSKGPDSGCFRCV